MNKYIIDDDFLYNHMKSVENIILENYRRNMNYPINFLKGLKEG